MTMTQPRGWRSKDYTKNLQRMSFCDSLNDGSQYFEGLHGPSEKLDGSQGPYGNIQVRTQQCADEDHPCC